MPENKPSVTWISLTERPPPAVVTKPRLLLRFRTKHAQDVHMGYYLGDGKVRILGHSTTGQLPLTLDEIDAWSPVAEAQLRKIEDEQDRRAESRAMEAPTPDQRYADRGDAKASSGRDQKPPAVGGDAPVGFADLEDPDEWASTDEEAETYLDSGIEPGYLFPGQQ